MNHSCRTFLFSTITVGVLLSLALPQGVARAQCAPPPSGLLSWWPGDGNTADIVRENTAVLRNGATFSLGFVGEAFSLDGEDSDVFVGNPSDLKLSGPLSIEAWIHTFDLSEGQLASILTKWGQSSSLDAYGLWLTKQGGIIRLVAAIGVAGVIDFGLIGGEIEADTWTHVAMTYDAGTGMNLIYVNGQAVASRVRNGGTLVSDQNVLIGREDSAAPRPFSGLLDEISIYNRTLSAAEILTIFEVGSAGKCPGPSLPATAVSARIAAGPNNIEGLINAFNVANLTLEVEFGPSSDITDEVEVLLSDGVNDLTRNTAGTDGAGTVTLSGLDASSLVDGPIIIQVKTTNNVGTSTVTFDGFLKRTLIGEGLHLYVASADGTVSVIDPNSTNVVELIDLGDLYIRTVEPSPDQGRVYVYSYFGPIYVIDTQINVIIGTISTTAIGGGNMMLTPDGRFLYVANNYGGRLVKVETESLVEIALDSGGGLPIGGGPFDMVMTPDASRLFIAHGFSSYSSSQDGSYVSVIDLATDTKIQQIETDRKNQGIAIHPDGHRVYVTNQATVATRPEPQRVFTIDTNTFEVTINTVTRYPTEIVVHPNGAEAFIVHDMDTGDFIYRWDLESDIPFPDNLPLGCSSFLPDGFYGSIDITEDGALMALTNTSGNKVILLYPGSCNYLVAAIHNIPGPKGVAFVTVPVGNTPPSADAGGPYSVDEGGSVTVTASAIDPEGDVLSFDWDLDGDGMFELPGQSVTFFGVDGPAVVPIIVRVSDGDLATTDQSTVEVLNVMPSVDSLLPLVNPIQIGTEIEATAEFTDAGVLDAHAAEWHWGDGATSPGVVVEADGSGTVFGTHIYSSVGYHTLTLGLTDDDGDAGQFIFNFIEVFDPDVTPIGEFTDLRVTENQTRDTHPVLDFDASGALHLAWLGDDGDREILYSTNSPGHFITPINVSNNNGNDASPAMAVDLKRHRPSDLAVSGKYTVCNQHNRRFFKSHHSGRWQPPIDGHGRGWQRPSFMDEQ